MSSPFRSVLFIVGVLLAIRCDTSWALQPDLAIDQFNHTSFGTKDGAPTDSWAMAQTRDGWLWFGGPTGLFRSDGMRFEEVDLHADQSKHSKAISALTALDTGELLIGYHRGGVSILRNGEFTHHHEEAGLNPDTVWCLARDADGSLWAGTRGGLLRFDGQRWRRIGADWEFPEGHATSVLLDQHGTLWVAAEGQVVSLDREKKRFVRHGLDVSEAADLILARDGRSWYADGVLRLLPGQTDVAPRSAAEHSAASGTTIFDRDGSLWSLRAHDISRVVPREGNAPIPLPDTTRDVFPMRYAKALFEERGGNIWISTANGLHRIRQVSVAKVFGQGLGTLAAYGDDIFMALLVSGFADSEDDGVWRFGASLDHVQAGARGWATSVYRDGKGTLWVGGRQGLWRYDGRRFLKSVDPPPNGAGKYVQAMAQDQAGDLWVAVLGAGLFRLREGLWQRNGDLAELPTDPPTALGRDASGRLWVGYANNQVATVESGRATLLTSGEGLRVGTVRAFGFGAQALVGGENGLAVFRDGRFESLTPSHAGAFEDLTGIVEIGNGDVWLNGGRGAVRILRASMQAAIVARAPTLPVEVLDGDDGYPGTGKNSAPAFGASMVADASGRIWVSGVNGVGRFDPARIYRNRVPPTPVIRSLISAGRRHSPSEVLNLSAGTRNLQVDYTALSASRPERLLFRYRLQGVDTTWVDAGARREAFYTNLEPGQYSFQVSAKNEADVWSATPATLDFLLPPTFTQTWIFRALCAAMVAVALALIYRVRVRHLTSRERLLAQNQLKERERIARELHDTLLQGTQALILKVQRASKLSRSTGAMNHEMLEEAVTHAEQVLAEGRDRIQDLRLSTQLPVDLASSLAAAGEELAQGGTVQFRATVEGPVRSMASDAIQEADRIGREAMLNAFHHAKARLIEVQIVYGRSDFCLRVLDDGIGIDLKVLEDGARARHWGLPGMRERASGIGARLDIRNRAGAGTEIELRIPAAVAYKARASKIRWP